MSTEIPRKIHILSECSLRRPVVRCPIPRLLRHRHVHAPPPIALPTTRPLDKTKKTLQPPCVSQPPDCRDDVRASVRARERLPGAHLRADQRSLRATSKRAERCQIFQVPEWLATTTSQS